MSPADWDAVERTLEVHDEQGNVVFANNLEECQMINGMKACTFYLSIDNPRVGLLLEPGAYGLMTYSSQWALPAEDDE